MKSCPEPRVRSGAIEVIVKAHEPFLSKGGMAMDLDILDGRIGWEDTAAWRGVRCYWTTSRLGKGPK